MKYIDAFRNPAAAAVLRGRVAALEAGLSSRGKRVTIMEVCGTHTMAIARYGIRDLLGPAVDLVSGPGCPVCVTPAGYIDAAIAIAGRGAIIATFGDLIQVPGSSSTLAACRSGGGWVEVCYSPMDAVDLAAKHPRKEVVFLAIGFETTIAAVVSIVQMAMVRNLRNVSLLTAFKLVPPALKALMADPEMHISAFLCPAHVSAIIGTEPYRPFAEQHGVPCVIAGFEPLDILFALEAILRQVLEGRAAVENQYSRVVRAEGNRKAQAVMREYLTPLDAVWRGLGCVPESGLGLRLPFADFDAEKRHGVKVLPGEDQPGCLCGDVVKGKVKPPQCPMFGRRCTPDRPYGPCMVSSEGTCAAWHKYSALRTAG